MQSSIQMRSIFLAAVLGCAITFAEGAPAPVDTITITNQRVSERPIDIKQGGQFIEPLCYLIPSMTAQQVANDSFEEEPPYKVAFKAELDKPYRPWYPDGAVHIAQYAFDTENPFNGKRCQRIAIKEPHCRAGVSQDGFFLQDGHTYKLHFHMRGAGSATVYASLHGDGKLLAGPVKVGEAGEQWQGVDATLKASDDVQNGALTIEFEGPGTLWLDRVSLIDTEAELGIWRKDVFEALKDMKPGVIRWGGSTTEGYEWLDCVGPWDKRAPFTTCWGGLEPNFVGMEEFVQLCQAVDAEPLLCIRWSGKKPEDAAAQVEYFNGGVDTKWGKVRADNGHSEPYHVKYWQIGNEVGGKDYDKSVRTFAEAMKKADPSIKILSAFVTDETLAKGGDYLDYLCPHHYGCADLLGKDAEFTKLKEQIARDGHGRDIRVAVTEWNTTAGDFGLGRGTLLTLSNALACSRYMNLMHRHADLVEIGIRSNLSDSFGSGVIQTGPGWLYRAPTYFAHLMYQEAAGSFPVQMKRKDERPWQQQQPDISAVASEDGKKLRIYAVNQTADHRPVAFVLEGFPAFKNCQITLLADTLEKLDPEVMNTRDDPARVRTNSHLETVGEPFQVLLQPYSVTMVEMLP